MHHFTARQECTDSLRHGSRSSGREIIMSQNQSTAASDSGLTCGKASCHACHHKKTPRSEAELKSLKNRLNRISGQLAGISRMLDDNRYCGDILTQVAAVESALQSFGYIILKEHMETCVVEEVQNGNTQIVEEAFELMRKLK